ncbi:hypothetical protein HMF8227_02365 [Saliniradius amylolyticus]|uniref:Uncharacterized protein n=1 Tax=Saliniradius amylolyticus TaxID=2183582 RepID=A0A2S2E775_9ALTE|nr:hypothetical protein [Saliniradius amylolyticus]AWL12817.1 hypothetical protein HMF8227_02365 [Saliniradius amylolyticus]
MSRELQINAAQLKSAMQMAGYTLFSEGDYNLNLIGIRSADIHNDGFNDRFCVLFSVAGHECLLQFPCTTDPGTYYRENPLNVDGSAIVKPDQYPGLWQLGQHQGKYLALVQRGEITVYRDADGDDQLDTDGIEQSGYFGINCHRASKTGIAKQVERFSAGCQVIPNLWDYNVLLSLCERAAAEYGNSFTYTLLTEQEYRAGGKT